MSKKYGDLKNDAVNEVFSGDKSLFELRKKLKIMLVGFCLMRVAFVVYETSFIVARYADISSALPNFIFTLLGLLFSYAIYNGAKSLSYLYVLGGLYLAVTSLGSEKVIDYIKTAGDVPYNIYMAILIFAAVIQIVMFAYIGVSKKYMAYFAACDKVNEKLSERR